MIELIEARIGHYFARAREIVQITEADYPFLPDLIKILDPIPITSLYLSKLGFNKTYATGVSYRAHNGMTVYLKPATANRWVVQFGNEEKVRFIQYIHEVQEVWYAFFGELLTRKEKTQPALRKLPMPAAQQFYLSSDYRYVFAPAGMAAFEVISTKYGVSFEFAGRSWGLQLQYGMPDRELIIQATDWLKIELERVGYKYM